MDANFNEKEALVARIQQLEHERDDLQKDIEQLCMQNAGPGYLAVATRMHFQRTAGLEQEIENLKQKLGVCIRENSNLQEELSEAYRVKSQLADLHSAEVLKTMEAEKQLKFFQGCVAAAFAERDKSVMEAEKVKEKEEFVSQQLDSFQERIEELTSECLEEKKLSTFLRDDLKNKEKENEIFKKVINRFYEIRGYSLKESDEGKSWYDKCECLLHDPEDQWSYGETSTSKYTTALEKEVDTLRNSLDNIQSKLQMGLEIECHLKKKVHDMEKQKIRLERKLKRGISSLIHDHSQLRIDIKNLVDKEYSHLKSAIDILEDKVKELHTIRLNTIPLLGDANLQESECRDVYVTTDAGSDVMTKIEKKKEYQGSNVSSVLECTHSVCVEETNVSDLPKTSAVRTGDDSEALAQALHQKVATLLFLSQQEERYLLESDVNAALQKKMEEFQIKFLQVTNEKVKALMELAQLKQENQLLLEKVNLDMKQGKYLADSEEKSVVQDKDGRLKHMLKKTYLRRWLNPLDSDETEARLDYEENISSKCSNHEMDFARMKIENAALKESLESMGHLTSSVHRLRRSLTKVTNEKVKALMELAQLKQENQLLLEKVNLDMKQGKYLADSEEKSVVQDKDGRLKHMLKKTYLRRWLNPLDSDETEARLDYEENISSKCSNHEMDFARMKIENAALKESLESMGHLTSSVHRLRRSLTKVKESVASEGTELNELENIIF